MNKKQLFFAFGMLLILLINTFVVYSFLHVKIGYVKSPELIEKYEATIKARSTLNEEMKFYQINLDSLISEKGYLDSVIQLVKEGSLEYLEMKKKIELKEKEINQYYEGVSKITEENSTKLLEGVFNQINSYIYQYGKDNNFDIIIGTTKDGNVLYGNETLDLTPEIIEGLNKTFKGDE